MAKDLTWILTAKDYISPVFGKIKESGESAAKGVGDAFGAAQSKFNLIKGGLAGIAAIATGGIFKSLISETIAWSSEAVALSKSLGITTAEASILNVALGDVYLSKDTMLAGSSRIAKALKTEEEAFHKLGVATRDQSGHYRDTLSIMTDVNTKLGALKEGTDRNVAGMSIYGKSWGELSSLIKLNNGVMDDAAKKAKELGLIVGDEQVAEMKKYKAAINDIEDVGKSLTLRFGNVLLPALIKVGAYLGTNGPVLANAFRWSLNALGFTIQTVGEWLGLMAYRAYSAFSIIGSALTGDFSGAKRQYLDMVAAGEDFNKRTRERWAKDWNKDEPITSKAIKGDQLDKDFGQEEKLKAEQTKLAAALKKKVDLYKDTAKSILEIEKERIKTLIDIEKEYLGKLKTNYDEAVSRLDSFRTAYTSVLDSIAARDKRLSEEKAAALRGDEDSYNRYYRLRAELRDAEAAVDNDPAWTGDAIAKKLKLYDDMISRAEAYRNDVRAGNVQNVSMEQAEADFLATKHSLEVKIKDLGNGQIRQQEDLAVKAAEAVTVMERAIKVQQDQLSIVEQMLKNIPNITEKELRINITGLNDLYRVQALTQGANASTGAEYFGDYYTMGGKTYWSDGSLAEDGTSVAGQRAAGGPVSANRSYLVGEKGPEIIRMGSQGGTVIPNSQIGGVTFGDINITVQGGGNASDIGREVSRQLYTQFQTMNSRKRAA